jgi:hypothetical protein
VFETALLLYENGLSLEESPLEKLTYENMSRHGIVSLIFQSKET